MARALWLPAVLRSAGLTVHEQPGWQTRGNSTFDPYGIIVHATAGRLTIETDIRVLLQGSTTAPPPIAQLFLARTGEWWVIASGRCNHARTGRAGNMAGYGNTNLLGVEAANDNKGEPWPDVQYRSYVRGVAAICDYVDAGASKRRWSTSRISGHNEHQPGEKTDPTFSMGQFRSDVAAVLAGDTPPTPSTPGRKRKTMEYLWVILRDKKPVWAVERPHLRLTDPAMGWEEFTDEGQAVGIATLNGYSNQFLTEQQWAARKAAYVAS